MRVGDPRSGRPQTADGSDLLTEHEAEFIAVERTRLAGCGRCQSRETFEECVMLTRPRLGVEVPEMTVQVAQASNPAGTTAMWVRAGSPVCETMRTSLAGISRGRSGTRLPVGDGERAAVPRSVRPRRGRGGAVPNRLQWALGLDPDNLDFYHSVLSDSRDRLLEEGRADRLLDLVMARLMEAGHGRRSNRPAHRLHPSRGARPDPAGTGQGGGPRRSSGVQAVDGSGLPTIPGPPMVTNLAFRLPTRCRGRPRHWAWARARQC